MSDPNAKKPEFGKFLKSIFSFGQMEDGPDPKKHNQFVEIEESRVENLSEEHQPKVEQRPKKLRRGKKPSQNPKIEITQDSILENNQNISNMQTTGQNNLKRQPEIKERQAIDDDDFMDKSMKESVNEDKQVDDLRMEKTGMPKKVKRILIIVAIALIAGIAGVLGALHCQILGVACPAKPKVYDNGILINRPFVSSQVFVANYSKFTTIIGNGNGTSNKMAQNQTIFYAVLNTTQTVINFIAYYKKISMANETYTTEMESSPGLETFIMPELAGNLSKANSNANETSTVPPANFTYVFKMFKFGLTWAGEITYFSFANGTTPDVMGQVPKLVKMFAPSLSKSLYINPPRLLQSNISNASSAYAYNSDDNGTSLANNQSLQSTSDSHNGQEEATSKSQFDKDGNLQGGELQAQTTMKSVDDPPDPTMNIVKCDATLNVAQNVSLNISQQFIADSEQVTAFAGWFDQQEQFASKFTPTQLTQYLAGTPINQTNSTNGSSIRLLQGGNGYRTLFHNENYKQVFTTNVMGARFSVVKQSTMSVDLQDLSDGLSSEEYVNNKVNLVLQIPFGNRDYQIVDDRDPIDPLTLDYTLQLVTNILNNDKPKYLASVAAMDLTRAYQHYSSAVKPFLTRIHADAVALIAECNRLQNLLMSSDKIDKINQLIEQMRVALDTQGLALYDNNVQTVNSTRDGLFAWANKSYLAAVQQFRQVQAQFKAIEDSGNAQITNEETIFPPVVNPSWSAINTIRGPELIAQYQAELLKAKPFYDYFAFVSNESYYAQSNLTSYYSIFNDAFNTMAKKIFDSLFSIILEGADHIQQQVINRNNTLHSELQAMRDNLASIPGVMNQTLMDRLRAFRNLPNWYYVDNPQVVEAALGGIPQFFGVLAKLGDGCGGWGPIWWNKSDCCVYMLTDWKKCADETYMERAPYTSLKVVIESSLFTMMKMMSDMRDQLNVIIDDTTIDIPTKYEKFNNIFSQFQNFQSLDSKYEADTYYVREHRQLDVLGGVNVSCGGHCEQAFLDRTVNAYKQMMPYVDDVHDFVDGYNNFTDIKKYYHWVSEFDLTNYQFILDHINHQESFIKDFLDVYEVLDTDTQKSIDTLHGLSVVDIEAFFANSSIKDNIIMASQNFASQIDTICSKNKTKQDDIKAIRKNYSSLAAQATNKSNEDGYLTDYLSQMADQYTTLSSSMFEQYYDLDFCPSINKEIQHNMTTVNDQLPNFAILYELKLKLIKANKANAATVSDLIAQLKYLDKIKYRIYDQNMFETFLKNSSSLINGFSAAIIDYGYQINQIKTQAQLIYLFNATANDTLTDILDGFTSVPYQLSPAIYGGWGEMEAAAIDCLALLNYDILKVYIFLTWSLEYGNNTLTAHLDGSETERKTFVKVCDDFMALPDTVEQDYLNELMANLTGIMTSFNSTVFSQIPVYKELRDWFGDLKFNSQVFAGMYAQGSANLTVLHSNTLADLQKYYADLNAIINNAINMVKSLKIGFLNDVIQMGVLDANVYQIFRKGMVKTVDEQMFALAAQVKDDYLKATLINSKVQALLYTIQLQHEAIIQNISAQINHRISNIQADPAFFASFQSDPIYNKATSVPQILKSFAYSSMLTLITPELNQISQLISFLTPDSTARLQLLSQVKVVATWLHGNFTKRLQNIEDAALSISNMEYKLSNMLTMNIIQDSKSIILPSLSNISQTLSHFFVLDQPNSQNLSAQNVPSDYTSISGNISDIASQYGQASAAQPNVQSTISTTTESVNNFVQDPTTDQVQSCQQSVSYIQSTPTKPPPSQPHVLKKHKIINKAIPFFEMAIPIPTQIGLFMVRFSIDLRIHAEYILEIQNTIDLVLTVPISTSLYVQVNFGYSLIILEVGIYFRGVIFDLIITVGAQVALIIPSTKTPSIVGKQVLKHHPKVLVFIDLEVKAVGFGIGVYLRFLWFRLAFWWWRFCIRCFFFSFCISIPIPYIQFYMKQVDFGVTYYLVSTPNRRIWSKDYTLPSLR